MTQTAHRPRAAWIAAVVGAWTGAALLLATQAYFAGSVRGDSVAWSRSLAIWLAWAYVWALLTPIILWLTARFPLERPRLARSLLIHGASSAILVVVDLALFAGVAPWVGALSAGPTWVSTFSRLLGTTFFFGLPVYWILVGAMQAVRLARTARERDRRAIRLEAQLSEARLLALREQLQPHFLFNALNSVSVLMHEDIEAADRVLVQLSGLLRRALESSAAQEVPLREEMAFLEAYLAIEQTRFTDRLSCRVDIAPDVLDARVQSLILQPLVENAVRHGLERSASPCRIEIAAERRDGRLHLSVRDDGPGLSPGAAEGVGLSNTRSRLELLYGDAHSFHLAPAPGGGLLVTLAIPLSSGRNP
jgi:two-component system, LytTR family, sensor kinase